MFMCAGWFKQVLASYKPANKPCALLLSCWGASLIEIPVAHSITPRKCIFVADLFPPYLELSPASFAPDSNS